MTSQITQCNHCEVRTRKAIYNPANFNFINGHIHGRMCKKIELMATSTCLEDHMIHMNSADEVTKSIVFHRVHVSNIMNDYAVTMSMVQDYLYCKPRVIEMPTLSSLATPAVVSTTTSGAPSDDKFGIMTTLGFQFCNFLSPPLFLPSPLAD